MEFSIGNDIKDGFDRTSAWVSANVDAVNDIANFYKQRAAIEREYADKLQRLSAEYFAKLAKQSSVLSVGDNPTITPGSLESASVVAWREVLIQCENISKEKKSLASKFDAQISTPLNAMHNKYANLNNRWNEFNKDLISKRDEKYSDMSSKKKSYDLACQSMESQRAKSIKSPNNEKLAESLHKKENHMNIAKNNYLISIAVSNRLKDKYYYQDLPEILDGLQDLNQCRVSKLNNIWKTSTDIEKKSLEKISSCLTAIDNIVVQNLPHLDTAMFIKHNLYNWAEPTDFNFIPSAIWHDDQDMVISDSTIYDLKVKLNNSCSTYEKYNTICNDEKQSLEELLSDRKEMLKNENYDKLENSLLNSITYLQKFTNNDTSKVVAEVEIETIQAVTHDIDMTITDDQLHTKKSKFSLFKIKKDEQVNEPVEILQLSENVNNFQIDSSNKKSRLFSSLNKLVDAYNTPINGVAQSSTSISSSSNAVALYDYTPQGDDEIPISANEQLTILDPDNLGWTYIKNASGMEGLVPTSYIKTIVKKKQPPPKVVPRKSVKATNQVRVLYDYEAQGDDELTVSSGDTVVLINDDGSGWSEVELNGNIGLIPTSYTSPM